MFKKIIKVFRKILEILRKPKLRKVLTQKIILAKDYLSVIGLIPEVKYLKSRKILTIFYDKAKEITFYETDKPILEILKLNFTIPNIDPKKDRDYVNFVLRRLIILAESSTKLLMIQRDIYKYGEPSLLYFYEETLKLFESIEKS